MIELKFLLSKPNTVRFTTTDHSLTIIGKLLIKDAFYKSDFIRAIVISPIDEEIRLDTCMLKTTDESVQLIHDQIGVLTITKQRFLAILTAWEDFLMHSLPEKTIECPESDCTFFSTSPKQELHIAQQ